MKPIIVVGSINIDVTVYLETWAKPGETIAARDGKITLGGKGANQAIAAARLGAEVRMIGAAGADGFGGQAIDRLVSEYINANIIRPQRSSTGVAVIDVNSDGANMIRLFAGANALLKPEDIQERHKVFEGAGIVLLQNEVPLDVSLEAARFGRAAGALVIMDPAPAPLTPWTGGQIACFDILTPNAHEAGVILGRTISNLEDGVEAAKTLTGRGLKGAIVTMGELGAAWAFDGKDGIVQPHAITAIDTVAAGDCFNGGLAFAMTSEMDFSSAIGFACDVASLATTKRGASESAPSLTEVNNFRRSNPR